MKKNEFDRFADQYDQILHRTIPDRLDESEYFAEYKISIIAANLSETEPKRILDFGCGCGGSLPYLRKYFPDSILWGFDVSLSSLEVASKRVPEAILFSDWSNLKDVHFDAIMAANVFHHIPLNQRKLSLKKCYEVLSTKGRFFLFEHNPYNPATRWIFEHCPFDEGAEMIDLKTAIGIAQTIGFRIEQYGYTLFFPRPLAVLRRIEPWLKRLPLGAQYFVQMTK